jgi:hypothetical protein
MSQSVDCCALFTHFSLRCVWVQLWQQRANLDRGDGYKMMWLGGRCSLMDCLRMIRKVDARNDGKIDLEAKSLED